MSYGNKIVSATGTTTATNEDIWGAMRTFSSFTADQEDMYYPFRPILTYFETDVSTDIFINNEGETFLTESGAGAFTISMEEDQGVRISKLVVAGIGVTWKATLLY